MRLPWGQARFSARKLVIVSRFCSREAVTRVGRRRPGEPLSTAPTARSPRQYRRGYDASPIRMAAPFAPCSAEFARLWRAAIPCRQRATRRSRVGTLPRADTARTGTLQEQGPGPIFRAKTGDRFSILLPRSSDQGGAPTSRRAAFDGANGAVASAVPTRLRRVAHSNGCAVRPGFCGIRAAVEGGNPLPPTGNPS